MKSVFISNVLIMLSVAVWGDLGWEGAWGPACASSLEMVSLLVWGMLFTPLAAEKIGQ